MRRLALAIATVFAAAAPAAFADHDTYRSYDNRDYSYGAYNNGDTRDSRGERARVLETRPVTEAAGQREECWNPRAGHFEEVRPDNHDNNRRNLAGTVIGGLAGGIIGHQIGSGTGNTAATIGGAALGAYAGNRVERNRNDDSQPDLDRSKCRVIGASGNGDNVQAYDVRYRWNGREYVARMDHDPGRYVEIGRDVNADGTPFNTLAESNYQPYPR
ncbi:MAG: glycine zipper 2TM domain-containing protein [Betaproteobacteria bacterium]